jgi:hypothetical protein
MLRLRLLFIIPVTLLFLTSCQHVQKDLNHAEEDRILAAAEVFFSALKAGSFEDAWKLLTKKSRDRIIDDVYRSVRRKDNSVTKKDVEDDFNKNGILFQSYWNSFRAGIDVEGVLNESRWEMGQVEDYMAVIEIKHPASSGITRLKLYREQGLWKVGLVETFWPNRARKFLEIIFR